MVSKPNKYYGLKCKHKYHGTKPKSGYKQLWVLTLVSAPVNTEKPHENQHPLQIKKRISHILYWLEQIGSTNAGLSPKHLA